MSIKSIVAAYDKIDRLDLRVLRVIEVAHRRFEYVPIDLIVRWCDEPWDLVSKSLRKLNALGMIVRWRGDYIGYRLNYLGYDVLALHTLAKRNIIRSLSPTPIGAGKESDVYVGETCSGDKVVIKLYRLGRTSFRQTRRFRIWVGDRRHITWLYESRLSAHMEYKALVLAHNSGVRVPKPIAVNRHALVIKYVDALPLSIAWRTVESGERLLEEIIEDMRRCYQGANIVHGDLSEYNIIVDANGDHYIIDWAQFTPRYYKGALSLLRRDAENVIEFFRRKFRISVDLDDVMKYVTADVEAEGLDLEDSFIKLIGEEELRGYALGDDVEDELSRPYDDLEA